MASVAVFGLVVAIGLGMKLSTSNDSNQTLDEPIGSKVFVGGDLHTLTVNGDEMTISGHESAAISVDLGKSWKALKALDGADVMAWAANESTVFAGGHNGLYISPLKENKFRKINFYGDVSDVHALGASGELAYLASPEFGLLASNDGGHTWIPRNTEIGQSFMGTMLVDPTNPLRVLAPDMQLGLLTSDDGGRSWESLGGPMGTMAITWNPTDTNEIAVLGMSALSVTKDGGATWSDISMPTGTAAIAYSSDGQRLFAAALDALPYAHVFESQDTGKTWSMNSSSAEIIKNPVAKTAANSEMDPNMLGMDHSESADTHSEETARPLKATLGFFGAASTIVMTGAFILRRKDKAEQERKVSHRKGRGISK